MRVSLPIRTVGLASLFLSTLPTACASRSMKSGVIGGWPTVPRMPSVPKYCGWRSFIIASPHATRLHDSACPTAAAWTAPCPRGNATRNSSLAIALDASEPVLLEQLRLRRRALGVHVVGHGKRQQA